MIEGHGFQQMADLFKLLSHPARLRILDELRRSEVCVCRLAAIVEQRQPYVSQQLMLLREGGVTESRRDGTFIYYRLANRLVEEVPATILGPTDQETHPEMCPCPARRS